MELLLTLIIFQVAQMVVNPVTVVRLQKRQVSNSICTTGCFPGYQVNESCCEVGSSCTESEFCEECVAESYSKGGRDDNCKICDKCENDEKVLEPCSKENNTVCASSNGSTVITTSTVLTTTVPDGNPKNNKKPVVVILVVAAIVIIIVCIIGFATKVFCWWTKESQEFWTNYFPCCCENRKNDGREEQSPLSTEEQCLLPVDRAKEILEISLANIKRPDLALKVHGRKEDVTQDGWYSIIDDLRFLDLNFKELTEVCGKLSSKLPNCDNSRYDPNRDIEQYCNNLPDEENTHLLIDLCKNDPFRRASIIAYESLGHNYELCLRTVIELCCKKEDITTLSDVPTSEYENCVMNIIQNHTDFNENTILQSGLDSVLQSFAATRRRLGRSYLCL
ncbi:uncharacterized protein LOC117122086 isoform X1 [Anneissia japonica]|uniref:uncharacterized protein LOC117122086 isoform X1 n=1 Tax=Anneissia japonica TaxID=1529436 RepID=UPI0014256562|nr:uncharacterized protein LOC117122086 isoform X1 [Anneissia japonica]